MNFSLYQMKANSIRSEKRLASRGGSQMHTRTKLLAVSLVSLVLASFVVTRTHAGAAQGNSEVSNNLGKKSSSSQRAKPTPTPDLPVTVTISDFIDAVDSSGATQRFWMQTRSDGAGSYTNTSSVQSIIQGASGDWILDTKNTTSPTRSVFLDFTKPIPGTGPNGGSAVSPFTSALVNARLISKCHLYNYDMSTIPVGVTVTCPLAIFFSSGSNDYMLQMNPGPNGVYLAPESDFVNITCNGASATFQCNNWTVTANGSHGGCLTVDCSLKQNVARLNKMVPIRGNSGSVNPVNQGDFDVALSIGITNP
jgi:hypothetical protein